MKRALLLPLIALGLAACTSPQGTSPPEAGPTVRQAPPATAAETPAEAAATAGELQGTPADSRATEEAGAGAAPTVDPTVQALADSFQLPLKGDPNAPLKIFEFSDYL